MLRLRHAKGKRQWWVVGVAGFAAVSLFVARHAGDGGRSPPDVTDVRQARQDWPVVEAEAAAEHVGRRAVVCGRVADTAYVTEARGQPTFLNLGRPYPRQVFTGVIWGDDRARFDRPEQRYAGERVCMAGPVREYEGTPQIVLRHPRQIELRRL